MATFTATDAGANMYDLLPWAPVLVTSVTSDQTQVDLGIGYYYLGVVDYTLHFTGAGFAFSPIAGAYNSVEILRGGISRGLLSGITDASFARVNALSVLDGGTDLLRGGAGSDTLLGGSSLDDTFIGNGGSDRFIVEIPSSSDWVLSQHTFVGAQNSFDTVEFNVGSLLDITGGAFESIEKLQFDLTNTVKLNAAQFGEDGISNHAQLRFNADAPTMMIAMGHSTSLDLSGLVITGHLKMIVEGTAGNDTVIGTNSPATDDLRGGDGNDSLFGGEGADLLSGGAGADYLNGGYQTTRAWIEDRMSGGDGSDTYIVSSEADIVKETNASLTTGGDDVVFANSSFTLGANVERLMLKGAAYSGTGNEVSNTITGNASANRLLGKGGADVLDGMAGNDSLDGGAGSDQMSGGAGNDTYIVDAQSDVVKERAGQGHDLILSAADYVLPVNVEDCNLVGKAHRVTGNNSDNIIRGNAENNTLLGLAGNDIIKGDIGNDVLDGGSGNDTLVAGYGSNTMRGGAGADVFMCADSGVDHILDFTAGTDKIRINPFPTSFDAPALKIDEFVVAQAPQTSNDRLIYNSSSGQLSYDLDGSGGQYKMVVFLVLDTKPMLTASDLFIL